MHKLLLIIPLLLLFSRQIQAQPPLPAIRGQVQDSATKQPLEDATIYLVHLPDNTIQRQLRTTKRGFSFSNLTPGNYRIITSYLGYATDTLTLTLSATDSTLRQVRILLQHSAHDLMQVVVHASIPPAIVRNDTIAFNAGAYPTRPNATVEDLLRKLPGIDIDKNGNITMQGQKVDKIYLDGKEFFLNDPRTATQNLPADIVDQIEAFDSQSEKARLTGIKETTGAKSINIKLKKNRKTGYFGKVYAGVGSGGDGTDDLTGSYSAGATATSLGQNWLFGSANINNINNQFTGTDNKNGPGGGGIQTFNNAQLNFRNNKESKLNVTINAGTNGSHTTLNTSTQRKTLLTDSSLYQNSYSQSQSHNQGYNGNAFVEYKPDTFNLINLRSSWSPATSSSSEKDTVGISTQKSTGSWLSNQGHTNNSNHADGYSINNMVNYRRRWHLAGRTLLISLNQSWQHQSQPASIYNLVNNYDSTGALQLQTLTNQRSAQHNNNQGYVGAVSYTEPLKPGHILDLSYRFNHQVGKSDRQSYDYDSLTGKYDHPDTLTTNHFINYNTIQQFSAGYNATEGKYRYQLGVTLQLSDLDEHNLTDATNFGQHQLNWYPRASLLYTPEKGKTFNFIYTANTTSPTIQQLQPLPDLTNPFLVRVGNPDLLQQITHNFNGNYTAFNSRNFQNLQISLQGDLTQHQITTATDILSGGIQQIQYVNVNDVWHASSNITYGFPLGDQRKGNSSIGIHGHYGRDISIVNEQKDVTTGLGWGANMKLNFHPVEKMFIEGFAGVDYTNSKYSIYPTQNTQTWQQTYSIDASYELPGALTIASNYNLQVTGSQGTLPTRSVSLWNASIYKDFLRDRRLQLRFSAFGILNTTSNYTQTVGLNYVETRQANLPGRILLLSAIYRFRKFPSEKKSSSNTTK